MSEFPLPVRTSGKDTKMKETKKNGAAQSKAGNEKIGRLLKTYGVAQLSDLPAEKYEAFLADVSQI